MHCSAVDGAQRAATLLWAAGVAGSAASALLPALRLAFTYGRLLHGEAPPAGGIGGRLHAAAASCAGYSVPKRWFTAFYILGAAVAATAMAEAHSCGAPWAALLPLLAFAAHAARRTYECLAVHRFSPAARMPAHLWLAGLAHYAAVPWTLSPPATLGGGALASGGAAALGAAWITAFVGAAVFAVGNVAQARVHSALAALRPTRTRAGAAPEYRLPTGGWFDAVVCPHYTAEVAIYAGLVVLRVGACAVVDGWRRSAAPSSIGPPLLMLLWVAANLSATAAHTRRWYAAEFPAAAAALRDKPGVFPVLACSSR